MSTDSTEPSSSSFSKSTSVISNSRNLHNTTTAIQTEGGGTTTVNNPTINLGVESTSESKGMQQRSLANPELLPVDDSHGMEFKDHETRKVLQTIHGNTWRETHASIGETFELDKLPEHDPIVYPRVVQSPKFYQGGHQMEDCQTFPKKRKLAELSMISVVDGIQKMKAGILGVVAPAGAGKTTCMKNWARHIMEMGGMTEKNNFAPHKGSRFQLVHFIDMRRVPKSSQILQDMLFQGIFSNPKRSAIAYDWLLKNQDKTVIFFDGLDQYTQSSMSNPNTGPMYQLLKRNLLPHACIVISARESFATSLPVEARIHDVITLTGFTKEDAKQLFDLVTISDLVVDINHRSSNWDILMKTSSVLVPFLSTPVFLMVAAVAFNSYGAPTNITYFLQKIIDLLPDSLIIQERKGFRQLVNKLKKLSYMGFENGVKRTIFSMDDLKRCDLSSDNVSDLMLEVPSGVFQGSNMFYFCHGSLQNFFSACFVVEKDLGHFKEFTEMEINQYHWRDVRHFVCGLIFAIDVNVTDHIEKQQILRKSLESQLKVVTGCQLLALYCAICETDDDALIGKITKIDFDMVPSWTCEAAHGIGSLIAKSKRIEYIFITFRNQTSDLLNWVAECLENCKVKVKNVVVSWTDDTIVGVTAINQFLQNIDSDTLHFKHNIEQDQVSMGTDEYDWNVIRRLRIQEGTFCPEMVFDNKAKSNSIEISWNTSDGKVVLRHVATFTKKDRLLHVHTGSQDRCLAFHIAEIAARYTKPSAISFKMKTGSSLQYLHHWQLDSILQWHTDVKVDTVILGCISNAHNDVDLFYYLLHHDDKLCSLVQLFQLKTVDIVIRAKDIHTIPNLLLNKEERDSHFGCKLRICVCETVHNNNSLQEISHELQSYEVDYLRLMILCGVKVEDITSFMNKIELTETMWLSFFPGGNMSKSDMQKLLDAKFTGHVQDTGWMQYEKDCDFWNAYSIIDSILEKKLMSSISEDELQAVLSKLGSVENNSLIKFIERVQQTAIWLPRIVPDISKLTDRNCFGFAIFAKLSGDVELQQHIKGFVTENFKAILASKGFMELTMPNFEKYFDTCDLGIFEKLQMLESKFSNLELVNLEFVRKATILSTEHRKKYCILTAHCHSFLKHLISDTNCLETANFAKQCKLDELKIWAEYHVISNFHLILSNILASAYSVQEIAHFCKMSSIPTELLNLMLQDKDQKPHSDASVTSERATFFAKHYSRNVLKVLANYHLISNFHSILSDISANIYSEQEIIQFCRVFSIPTILRTIMLDHKGGSLHARTSCASRWILTQLKKLFSVTKRTIGAEGGTIELNGCSVSFPKGALSVDEEITVMVNTDNANYPQHGKAITPIIYVEPSVTLKKPATITLESCSIAYEGHRMPVQLCIDEGDGWKWFREVELDDTCGISFLVNHFTGFSGMQENSSIISLKNDIYIQAGTGMITSCFYEFSKDGRAFKSEMHEKCCSSFCTVGFSVNGNEEETVRVEVELRKPEAVTLPHGDWRPKLTTMKNAAAQNDYHIPIISAVSSLESAKQIFGEYKVFVGPGNEEKVSVWVQREWPVQPDPAPTGALISVQGDLKVDGDMNVQSKGRTDYREKITAQMINHGDINSRKDGCTDSFIVQKPQD